MNIDDDLKRDLTKEPTKTDQPIAKTGFVLAVVSSLALHGLAAAAIFVLPPFAPQKTEALPRVEMIVVDLLSFKSGTSSHKETHTEQKSLPGKKELSSKSIRPVRVEKETKLEKAVRPANKAPVAIPPVDKPAVQKTAKKTRSDRSVAKTNMVKVPEIAPETPIEKAVPPAPSKLDKLLEQAREKRRKADLVAKPRQLAALPALLTRDRPVEKTAARVRAIRERMVPAEQAKITNIKKQKPKAKSKTGRKEKKPKKKAARKRTKKNTAKQKARKIKTASLGSAAGRGIRKKGRSRTGRTQGASYRGAGLSNPRPKYPSEARRRNQQGRVLLRVRVARNGRAGAVRVAKTSGHGSLDRAARRAVQRWRFRPALQNGRPVGSTVTVPISFRLRN